MFWGPLPEPLQEGQVTIQFLQRDAFAPISKDLSVSPQSLHLFTFAISFSFKFLDTGRMVRTYPRI